MSALILKLVSTSYWFALYMLQDLLRFLLTYEGFCVLCSMKLDDKTSIINVRGQSSFPIDTELRKSFARRFTIRKSPIQPAAIAKEGSLSQTTLAGEVGRNISHSRDKSPNLPRIELRSSKRSSESSSHKNRVDQSHRVLILANGSLVLAQSSINQSIILFSNAGYRKAAIRLMWTYNELIKCETKIIYKITLWYLNIQYESLK